MSLPLDASFKGTDWLTLETTLEVVGGMIGVNSARLYAVTNSEHPDSAEIQEIEDEIGRLSKEILLCYDKDNNHEIIIKAYTVYAPQLKAHYLQMNW